MKKKIVNALLMAALVVPSVGTLTSCKDYNEDLSTEVGGKIASMQKTLQDQIDKLNQLVASIKSCECDLSQYLLKSEAASTYVTQSSIQDYLNQISANKTAIAALEGAVEAINAKLGNLGDKSVAEQISELNATILQVSSVANEALELAKNGGKCTCDFTEINKKIADLEGLVAGWDEQLKAVNTKAAEALAKAERDSIWIAANRKTIDSLKNVITDSKVIERIEVIEKNYFNKEEVNNLITEVKESIVTVETLAKEPINKAGEALDKANDNADKIDKLEKAVKEYVTKTEFKEKLDIVDGRIDELSAKIDEIDAEIIKIKKDLSNLITGIIGHATENPVLGYINTPFGVNVMMLAAYYGSADNGIEFPARDGKYYLEGSDVNTWTPRNLEVMGISSLKNIEGYFTKKDEVFVTEVDGDVEGNAGTIYVTVNPSNVNFTGQQLGLETSAQNASPITISPLKPSNRELDFTIQRNTTRSVENGFYEAQATLRTEDIDKAKLTIDFEAIGSAIKSVIKDGPQDSRTRISVAEAAAKVFSAIDNTVPAYGLKASWTDEANNQTHNLYSQYNIGVTAIKPLSFAFMKDSKLKHIDGFGRIRSVVSRVIREVEIALPDFSKYEIQFKSIKIGKDITTTDDGEILTPVKFTFADETDVLINVNSDITETITELVDAINERYGEGSDVDQKLAEFFNEVKETNNFQTYVDETKESVYAAIDKYLTRIEEHLLRLVNNAHRTLYITMFGNQNGKFALLSNTIDEPTKAKAGEFNLIPTTYTLQYFAPVYKKFVAVTNVYDAATKEELALGEAQSVAAAANGGMNMFKVVDGLKNCSFTGEAGKIYELTYTAVDYHGVVMIKKFYVEF